MPLVVRSTPRLTVRRGSMEAELDDQMFHVPKGKGSNSSHYKRIVDNINFYVLMKCEYGSDMSYILRNLEEPNLEKEKPAGDYESMSEEVDRLIFMEEMKYHMKRLNHYPQNKGKLYGIVWGKCTEAMRGKLQMCPNFENYEKTDDVVSLLKHIRSICFGFPPDMNVYTILHKVKRAYSKLYQFNSESTYYYYERFKDIVDMINYYGGDIGCDRGLIRDVAKSNGEKDWETIDFGHEKYKEFSLIAQERMYAMDFLLSLDHDRFGTLRDHLHNSYCLGTDLYPKTLSDAYRIASNYRPDVYTNSEANGGGKVSSGKKNG